MLQDIVYIFPEVMLFIGALLLLLLGVYKKDNAMNVVMLFSMILLGIILIVFCFQMGDGPLLGKIFINNDFTILIKFFTVSSAFVALVLSNNFMKLEGIDRFEYPVLILLAVTGMCLMVSTHNLIMLYMGIELQSLALYILAAFNRESYRSSEAGLKYFILGALGSCLLLYGISFIYGVTGQVGFLEIATLVSKDNIGLIVGMVFLLAGLSFKISAVPFHMWTPDVYEGSPTPITAFFSTAPKIVTMAVLIHVLYLMFPTIFTAWQQIIIFLSMASMAVGAFAGIGQRNIKRLMAYSSIGHIGFALVGLSVWGVAGVSSVLVYMVLYIIMTCGVFACVLSMRTQQGMVEHIDDLAGLSRTHPFMAFCLSVLIFSLAGIPPLAGFFGKFFVFEAALNAGLYPLAIFGVLMSVVSAYYYLRIVKIIYFDDPAEETFLPVRSELSVIYFISSFAMLLLFLYPRSLTIWVEKMTIALLQYVS